MFELVEIVYLVKLDDVVDSVWTEKIHAERRCDELDNEMPGYYVVKFMKDRPDGIVKSC